MLRFLFLLPFHFRFIRLSFHFIMYSNHSIYIVLLIFFQKVNNIMNSFCRGSMFDRWHCCLSPFMHLHILSSSPIWKTNISTIANQRDPPSLNSYIWVQNKHSYSFSCSESTCSNCRQYPKHNSTFFIGKMMDQQHQSQVFNLDSDETARGFEQFDDDGRLKRKGKPSLPPNLTIS